MSDFFGSQTSALSLSEGMSARQKIALTILIVIAIGVITAWWIRTMPQDVVHMGPTDIGPQVQLDPARRWISLMTADQIAKKTGNNVTCSFFLYLDPANVNRIPNNDPTRNFHYFLTVGNTMGISVNPVEQTCSVDILQTTPTQYNGAMIAQKNEAVRSLTVKPLLAARWNQVTVCVEGRSIDVYLNAKLTASAVMDNVPTSRFSGILLNGSPDFEGQICLVQVWKERKTAQQIAANYRQHTDARGKPTVPDPELTFSGALDKFWKASCEKVGFCGFTMNVGPLDYVEYEFA
jgi:hypothetical protein